MIEVEVKSLLGSIDAVTDFLSNFPSAQKTKNESQLNHYFVGDLGADCLECIAPHISKSSLLDLSKCLQYDKKSIRTRQIIDADPRNPCVLLIIKASLNSTTSENGTVRKEVEVPVAMTIDRLDSLLIEHGLQYQAKWSRERQGYQYGDVSIAIDKNAGYGYLAELEMMVESEEESLGAESKLHHLLEMTGFNELPQDRLERMFKYYNANWREYYGTEKTFAVE